MLPTRSPRRGATVRLWCGSHLQGQAPGATGRRAKKAIFEDVPRDETTG